nr:hypothetical protein [uncultured Halomonas sp.]
MTTENADLPRFTIRQFSRRVGCNSLTELKATLNDAFAGESVSIQYTRASGLSATLFVDVTQQGAVLSQQWTDQAIQHDYISMKEKGIYLTHRGEATGLKVVRVNLAWPQKLSATPEPASFTRALIGQPEATCHRHCS